MANKRNHRTVYLETRTAGQAFGTIGVVYSILGKRKLAETDPYPCGFTGAALAAAAKLAEQNGWTIIDRGTGERIQ